MTSKNRTQPQVERLKPVGFIPYPQTVVEPRVIPTADVLRTLPYHSPAPGWHSHGLHLVPTDGCAACAELKRRQAADLTD